MLLSLCLPGLAWPTWPALLFVWQHLRLPVIVIAVVFHLIIHTVYTYILFLRFAASNRRRHEVSSGGETFHAPDSTAVTTQTSADKQSRVCSQRSQLQHRLHTEGELRSEYERAKHTNKWTTKSYSHFSLCSSAHNELSLKHLTTQCVTVLLIEELTNLIRGRFYWTFVFADTFSFACLF